jgi:hypothetical protein
MTRSQYRALEALVDADWIGTLIGPVNDLPAMISRASAAALERRGLARIFHPEDDSPFAKATTAGAALLRSNPEEREQQ